MRYCVSLCVLDFLTSKSVPFQTLTFEILFLIFFFDHLLSLWNDHSTPVWLNTTYVRRQSCSPIFALRMAPYARTHSGSFSWPIVSILSSNHTTHADNIGFESCLSGFYAISVSCIFIYVVKNKWFLLILSICCPSALHALRSLCHSLVGRSHKQGQMRWRLPR